MCPTVLFGRLSAVLVNTEALYWQSPEPGLPLHAGLAQTLGVSQTLFVGKLFVPFCPSAMLQFQSRSQLNIAASACRVPVPDDGAEPQCE